jgi:hypothetical protein
VIASSRRSTSWDLLDAGVCGTSITDADLASLAIEHGSV